MLIGGNVILLDPWIEQIPAVNWDAEEQQYGYYYGYAVWTAIIKPVLEKDLARLYPNGTFQVE